MSIRPRTSARLAIASTWDGHPIPPTEQVRLRLRLTAHTLRVALAAPFHADPPPLGPPGPTDRLWEHEVVELFVAATTPGPDVPYTEIELSPWGHHLVLRLQGVRRIIAAGLPLRLRTCRRGDRWLAFATLDRVHLPPPPWRVNAFAIHGVAGARRHLAFAPLPGPRPDFHQPERFAPLPLDPAG